MIECSLCFAKQYITVKFLFELYTLDKVITIAMFYADASDCHVEMIKHLRNSIVSQWISLIDKWDVFTVQSMFFYRNLIVITVGWYCGQRQYWLCGDRDETVNHVLNECSNMAQKEYKKNTILGGNGDLLGILQEIKSLPYWLIQINLLWKL